MKMKIKRAKGRCKTKGRTGIRNGGKKKLSDKKGKHKKVERKKWRKKKKISNLLFD